MGMVDVSRSPGVGDCSCSFTTNDLRLLPALQCHSAGASSRTTSEHNTGGAKRAAAACGPFVGFFDFLSHDLKTSSKQGPTSTPRALVNSSMPKKRAKAHQPQLLRSQPLCLHPSMTFETTLTHLLSFLCFEEVEVLCFEVGAVRGAEIPTAWRAVCEAAAAEHVFLSTKAGVHFPGGWYAFFVDRCDPLRPGFWREKAAAEAAAKAEVVMMYPDIARMNEFGDGPSTRRFELANRASTRQATEQATKEFVQLCSLPAAVQCQPETLLRVRELLAAGANPNEFNQGPNSNPPFLNKKGVWMDGAVPTWEDTVQDKCLYAVKSVAMAQMLLAAGAYPNGGAADDLEKNVRHVLDVQEEFDSAKPGDLQLLLRQHGSSSSLDNAMYLELAEAVRTETAYKAFGEVEHALESSVAELETKLSVTFNKKQLKSFAEGDPRVLKAKQRKMCTKTRRTLRQGHTAQQLETLDCALLAECAMERCDNARVLSLLLQGALPEYHEGEAYWPCPMSVAVEACNLGALRLLLAAGGDIDTRHLREEGDWLGLAGLLHLADDVEGDVTDWLKRQRPPVMTVLLETFGIMHKDDVDEDDGRFDDMACYEP